jgi:hypothetical protein
MAILRSDSSWQRARLGDRGLIGVTSAGAGHFSSCPPGLFGSLCLATRPASQRIIWHRNHRAAVCGLPEFVPLHAPTSSTASR